jgi:hypothetical protein
MWTYRRVLFCGLMWLIPGELGRQPYWVLLYCEAGQVGTLPPNQFSLVIHQCEWTTGGSWNARC